MQFDDTSPKVGVQTSALFGDVNGNGLGEISNTMIMVGVAGLLMVIV